MPRKQLTMRMDPDDSEGLPVGYQVHTVLGGPSDYGHFELRILVRRYSSYDGEEYWDRVVVFTAQNNRLSRYIMGSEDYKGNKTEHRIPWMNDNSTSDYWGGWYALQLNRWDSDDIERQLFQATQFAPIWKRIKAVVKDKNLEFKYRDGVSHIIAALNILGATPLKNVDGSSYRHTYDSRFSVLD